MRVTERTEVYVVAVWRTEGYGILRCFDSIEQARAKKKELEELGFKVVDLWKETKEPVI